MLGDAVVDVFGAGGDLGDVTQPAHVLAHERGGLEAEGVVRQAITRPKTRPKKTHEREDTRNAQKTLGDAVVEVLRVRGRMGQPPHVLPLELCGLQLRGVTRRAIKGPAGLYFLKKQRLPPRKTPKDTTQQPGGLGVGRELIGAL